ncbi:MAG: DUF547 domain-containing protein [Emcibacter sp.]|nr:DUF547 domain-containing protein [Emcibacter sp.]
MAQYSGRKSLKYFLILTSFAIIASLQFSHAEEQATNNITNTITHDPNSKIVINYETLTLLLQATVTRPRLSSRIYSQKSSSSIGTRINLSNKNPTRLEASRTFYHFIQEQELEYIQLLRQAIEALPQTVPLQHLNRDEQLAYWLNLYNITVYEQLAKRYPIRKLKKLRQGSRKSPSLWAEKIMTVNGMALSLNDIQYNIIQKTWRDPLVIYGLYQGTIGGPNLRRKAYTGKLVYEQLADNAEEFVNSLRGIRFKGKDAHVSKIYDWNRALFPNFDHDLRRHLRKYANLRLVTKLDSSRRIKVKFYDWHIADVLNGGRATAGGAGSTNPVSMMLSFGGENAVVEGMSSNDFETNTNSSYSPQLTTHTAKALDTSVIRNSMPFEAAVFLKEFVERNRKFISTNVTVEEIDKQDLQKIKDKTSTKEEKNK